MKEENQEKLELWPTDKQTSLTEFNRGEGSQQAEEDESYPWDVAKNVGKSFQPCDPTSVKTTSRGAQEAPEMGTLVVWKEESLALPCQRSLS